MSSKSELQEVLNNMKDPRLAMFVVCCHVDKPLGEKEPESIYNIPIQAGAALTDKRVCAINDFDNSEDNISDRNQRYCEMTAIYWAWKNSISDYIGITHYRRRFVIDDTTLSKYMDQDVDIITTSPYKLPEIVSENYRVSYFGCEWDMIIDILQRKYPEYMDIASVEFAKDTMHPCNINIFKRSLYNEYCEFIFSILDEYFHNTPVKFDTYQRRDAGFIAERLSSLFVEKKRAEGCSVIEVPFSDLRSKDWCPEDECDLSDFDAVYSACQKYYLNHNITRCRNLVAGALNHNGITDKRIESLARLFQAAIREQRILPQTMYEYLPEQWKSDLDTLMSAYNGLRTIVGLAKTNSTPEVQSMYKEFINATGFSKIAIDMAQ